MIIGCSIYNSPPHFANSIYVFEKFKKYATFALLFLKATNRINSNEKNVSAFSEKKKK